MEAEDDPTEAFTRIDPTETIARPVIYSYKPRRPPIDLRYWMKVAVYSCMGILLVLGIIIAVALTLMVLRYINSKPA